MGCAGSKGGAAKEAKKKEETAPEAAPAEAAAGEAPVSEISFLSKMCPLCQKSVGTIFGTSVLNA